MGNWFRRFMLGRYGPDHLGVFTLILSVVLTLIGGLTGWWFISIPAYILVIITIFRMFSRNIPRRRAENDRFLKYWWPVRTKIVNFWKELKSRQEYKYFRCPDCKNKLRVPRGKGKIKVTCPRCGSRFEKKT